MKLSTSTGDFSGYARSVAEKVRELRSTKLKYINLEQSANDLYFEDGDGYLALARDFADAALRIITPGHSRELLISTRLGKSE